MYWLFEQREEEISDIDNIYNTSIMGSSITHFFMWLALLSKREVRRFV